MNINFKGDYFDFIFLTKSDWTLSIESIESMDNVQWVDGLPGPCPVYPWTMSRECAESMDFLQTGFG